MAWLAAAVDILVSTTFYIVEEREYVRAYTSSDPHASIPAKRSLLPVDNNGSAPTDRIANRLKKRDNLTWKSKQAKRRSLLWAFSAFIINCLHFTIYFSYFYFLTAKKEKKESSTSYIQKMKHDGY